MNKKNTYIIVVIIILVALAIYFFGRTQTSVAPVIDSQVSNSVQTTVASSTQTSTATSSAPTSYSLSDISKHNKATDCWMAVNGKVLNVTEFIASGQHDQKIIKGCGIDATSIFSKIDKHQGTKAQGLMTQFTIGKLK